MKALFSGKRGFSTLEILIAFSVLIISLVAVITVVFGNQSLATDTQVSDEALSEAQASLEVAEANAALDFNLVVSTSTTQVSGPVIFNQSLTVSELDPFTKQATSTVSWQSDGRTQSVFLSTLLTDWLHLGSKCSLPVGNWMAPKVYAYEALPASLGATGVDAERRDVYLTADPNSSSVSDFYILNDSTIIQNGGNLPILSQFSTTYGLTDVAVTSSYAFVAADSAQYQLLVVDVSDPTHLDASKIKAKLDFTAPGDSAVGNTLTYANNFIYLGLTKSTGQEFRIVDVSSPTAPKALGGFKVGSEVNQIIVDGTLAYLVTASTSPVLVLDVSNPSSPKLISSFSNISAVLTGESLALSGNQLLVGMVGGSANPKFFALATSSIAGAPSWTMTMNKKSGVFAMIPRGNLLFVTTSDPSDGFQIWNISNPSSPPVRFDTTPLNLQQTSPAGMDCSGNLLYVAEHGAHALEVVGPS